MSTKKKSNNLLLDVDIRSRVTQNISSIENSGFYVISGRKREEALTPKKLLFEKAPK